VRVVVSCQRAALCDHIRIALPPRDLASSHPRALDPTGSPRPDHPVRPDRPPRPQRITPDTPARRPSTTPGVEPGATQATSGDLSHPHSTTTTKTGRTRPNQDPNERRETSRLRRRASSPCLKVGTQAPQTPWRTVTNRAFECLLRGFWAGEWITSGNPNAQCNSAPETVRDAGTCTVIDGTPARRSTAASSPQRY
jgi:hypothetical protein